MKSTVEQGPRLSRFACTHVGDEQRVFDHLALRTRTPYSRNVAGLRFQQRDRARVIGIGEVSVRRAPFLTAYGVATSIRFGSRAERSKLPKPQP